MKTDENLTVINHEKTAKPYRFLEKKKMGKIENNLMYVTSFVKDVYVPV